MSVEISRQVVETKLFPLLEVENGQYHLNYIPEKNIPVADVLKLQGRFAHVFNNGSDESQNEIQEWVDTGWNNILEKVSVANKN